MTRRDFLVEIGTEELPPRSLKALADAFAARLTEGLQSASLAHGRVHRFATPRRLAVLVKGLAEQQPEQKIEKRGPAVAIAFDAGGAPTRAALAFAQSCGTPVESLQRITEPKGEFLFYKGSRQGGLARELLPGIVQAALDALPIPKRMRWGGGEVEFVRPVHWVVLLFGQDVLPARILGVESGRTTHGHRFHSRKPLRLASPGAYLNALRKRGYVLADFEQRREKIRTEVIALANQADGVPVFDEELLDEVTALVEWPVPLLGNFAPEFLQLPREVLVATLQDHQRYFPLRQRGEHEPQPDQLPQPATLTSGHKDIQLLPHFIAVANLESRDPAQVRVGNERVVRPRLSDARFFFETDRKTRLGDRLARLASIVYHNKLGSRLDRTERVRTLAKTIAQRIGAAPALADRAALLSKADLATQMVGEFPELQGTMGRYYALSDGEDPQVAQAIEDHYRPRFAGDALPGGEIALAVALADKLETLAGLFGIGQQPTGEKDPFALRRHALGVVRILVERSLPLRVSELTQAAYAVFPPGMLTSTQGEDLLAFLFERLRSYLRESGYSANEVESVLCLQPERLDQAPRQLAAVREFARLPEAQSLSAANKRIGNILKKADEAHVALDAARLIEPAEKALAQVIELIRPQVERHFQSGDYTHALKLLAEAREPVDTFFNDVMVMAEDPQLRLNRIALLRQLHGLMNQVADLSRLTG